MTDKKITTLNGVCLKCDFEMAWVYESYGNLCRCSRCDSPVFATKPIKSPPLPKVRKKFIQKYDAKRERTCIHALARLTDAESILFMSAEYKGEARITRNMGTAIGAIRRARRFLEKDIDEQNVPEQKR
jgi:hypothetical protein